MNNIIARVIIHQIPKQMAIQHALLHIDAGKALYLLLVIAIGIGPVIDEAGSKHIGLHRSAKKITLINIGTQITEQTQLLFCFHALQANQNIGEVCQLLHRADKAIIISTLGNITDEALVNLDDVKLQALQIAKTGIASTKIIYGNINAGLLPQAKDSIKLIEITQMHAFSDF